LIIDHHLVDDLAAIVLAETPTPLELLGSALVLSGVYIALRPARQPSTVVSMGEPAA
jgi:drug/metabolite transporter (DMT)-like permease